MKQSITSILPLISLLVCAQIQAEDIENSGVTIITDNFRIEDAKQTDNSVQIRKQSEELGSLGDKKVVAGQKSPHHLAFVKTPDEHNYIITDKILVQCAKGVNCIPGGMEFQQISSTVYEITVQDYEQWEKIKEELNHTEGVINVSPSYEHGLQPSLK